MKIMTIDAPSVEGGRALALCEDDGTVVGRQIACTIACAAGEMSVATVTFYIDGETIALGEIG